MTQHDLNPFAAPGVQDELSKVSDWEMATLRKGLKLLLGTLCIATIIEFSYFLLWCFRGANPLGLLPALLIAAKPGGFAVGCALLIAIFFLFRSTPAGNSRRMAAVVLFLAGTTPTVVYIFPILAREVAGGQILGWIVSGGPAFRFLLSCTLLMLLRLIAIQLEQRMAERIVGPAILAALAATLMPYAIFNQPASVMEIIAVSFASSAAVSLLKGIVVYILLVHVKATNSETSMTEVT